MKEWIYGALISFCFIVVLGAAYLPNTVAPSLTLRVTND